MQNCSEFDTNDIYERSVSQQSKKKSNVEDFKLHAVKVLPKINHVIIGINSLLIDERAEADSDKKSIDHNKAPKDTEQHRIDRLIHIDE